MTSFSDPRMRIEIAAAEIQCICPQEQTLPEQVPALHKQFQKRSAEEDI